MDPKFTAVIIPYVVVLSLFSLHPMESTDSSEEAQGKNSSSEESDLKVCNDTIHPPIQINWSLDQNLSRCNGIPRGDQGLVVFYGLEDTPFKCLAVTVNVTDKINDVGTIDWYYTGTGIEFASFGISRTEPGTYILTNSTGHIVFAYSVIDLDCSEDDGCAFAVFFCKDGYIIDTLVLASSNKTNPPVNCLKKANKILKPYQISPTPDDQNKPIMDTNLLMNCPP